MENLTLPQLLMWLHLSEKTGSFRGYSRHELALEYNRRVRYMKSFLHYKK